MHSLGDIGPLNSFRFPEIITKFLLKSLRYLCKLQSCVLSLIGRDQQNGGSKSMRAIGDYMHKVYTPSRANVLLVQNEHSSELKKTYSIERLGQNAFTQLSNKWNNKR